MAQAPPILLFSIIRGSGVSDLAKVLAGAALLGGRAWRISGSIHERGCFAMVWLATLAGVFFILAPVGGWGGGADSLSDHSKIESEEPTRPGLI